MTHKIDVDELLGELGFEDDEDIDGVVLTPASGGEDASERQEGASREDGTDEVAGGEDGAYELDEGEDLGSRKHGVTRLLGWRGRVLSLADWARQPECTVTANSIGQRIGMGWTVRDAITLPKGGRFQQAIRSQPRVINPSDRPEDDAAAPVPEVSGLEERNRELSATLERYRLEIVDREDRLRRLSEQLDMVRPDPPERVERPPRHERVTGGPPPDVLTLLSWISGRLGVEGETAAAEHLDRILRIRDRS